MNMGYIAVREFFSSLMKMFIVTRLVRDLFHKIDKSFNEQEALNLILYSAFLGLTFFFRDFMHVQFKNVVILD